ncbi:hypothetical protein ACQPWW_00510 [Micromonospora sp. CA-240977]|uniref:hypothetical protein n=1 Tax=Micromonospora sp. CA-240977 TaxID=3239957 RepID=UPI003D93455A
MDIRERRAGTVRMVGNLALMAGFVISLLSMPSGSEQLKPQILAAFLILTGLGLRIEAAIVDRKP